MNERERIEQLMRAAIADKREEAAFFRALLDATVYVHAPLSADRAYLRLVQFARADGITVVPFFTDIDKALRAGQSAVRIVSMSGRQLMEATQGLTLMLNPNDETCTLYPEEVATLLADGVVARIDTLVRPIHPADVGLPEANPFWLIDALKGLFSRLRHVDVAYLLQMNSPHELVQTSLLVVVGVKQSEAERVARAAITLIQPMAERFEMAIDLTTFDSVFEPPEWLSVKELKPFYLRGRPH